MSNIRTLPELHLFLLPNKFFNSELADFTYAFEMLLRMPRCTELIQESEGTFFYCKFGIFHLVVPACEESKKYFKTFKNCLNLETKTLQWSILPKAEKTSYTTFKSCKFIYPQEDLANHFPEVLLRWCCSLYSKYVSRVFNQPKCEPGKLPLIKGHCSVYLERFHFSTYYEDSQYPGFETTTRMKVFSVLAQQSLQIPVAGTMQLDNEIFDGKFDDEECLQSARGHSPLQIFRNLRLRLGESEAQCKEVEDKLGATMKELGLTRKELGKEKVRRTKSEMELRKLHERFLRTKASRCAELRRLISRSYTHSNKHSLSTEVSSEIKEIEKNMLGAAETAWWDQHYSSEYKDLLQKYRQLQNWLHQSNLTMLKSTSVRHHSHS